MLLENIQKDYLKNIAKFNIYDYPFEISKNKEIKKFIPLGMTKSKFVFEIKSIQLKEIKCELDNFILLLKELPFSVTVLSIPIVIDSDYIENHYMSRFKEVSDKDKNNVFYLREIIDSKMMFTMYKKEYILIDKEFDQIAISFFRKYGYEMMNVGIADEVLKDFILTEEEYINSFLSIYTKENWKEFLMKN